MLSKSVKYIQGALFAGLLAFSFQSCSTGLSQEEEDALAFLYENMPLPDSVDYSREYWEGCVKATVKARHEMPWGEKVPEREWKHFVLPVRVNNENLDSARMVLFDQLKNRVKDMNMYEAVLEVNHWCHEHVSYAPSNSRTKSPLVTMRTSTGRCGEESTFTVAALRAVGIPARQVYTPRWAHTDDNHAWVEAWVNGKWYFLGACEPEPVLNLGWFNAPASRGMLMHTKVFGNYDGPEEVVGRNSCYTEINVTANYAPTDTVVVRVQDAEGHAVVDAKVDFRLYNYAEFFSLVSKQSDAEGLASLGCGKGDLLVWASKDGKFGFEKASVGRQDSVLVVLDKDESFTGSFDIDLTPPEERNNIPEQSDSQKRENRRRLAREDSLRNAYMKATFYSAEGADADEYKPEVMARANWKLIHAFRAKSKEAEDIVKSLCEKDLQDVSEPVLEDVLQHCKPSDHPLWHDYVMQPRISNEMLTPYRQTLRPYFDGMTADKLAQWVMDSLRIDDASNPQKLCMSPAGVLSHRVTDHHSRDIFFVAAARSIDIPARIDEVTGKVQWADASNVWHSVNFGNDVAEIAPQGKVCLTYKDFDVKDDPSYYTHFSLSLIKDGRPQLQEFGESETWSKTFAHGAQMDAGQYMMVSGSRLANGGVLAHIEFFGLKENEEARVPLKLRTEENVLRVIGNFNCENYFTNRKGVRKTILETTGRGYYLVALIRSNHEPSTHVLHDMEACNIHLSQWPHCFMMLFPSQEEMDNFNRKEFDDLPDNFIFGVADPETVEAMHIQELSKGSTELPIMMITDTFNRVVWYHQGYTIGIGEQVMTVIRRLMLNE